MSILPKAIIDLTNSFERLPGIGPKSANRLAFYLMNAPRTFGEEMAKNLLRVKDEVKICQQCFGVSEKDYCDICKDEKRNKNLICVVERTIDVVALEKVGGYKGVYHVLGGVINPLDHIGPESLKIEELLDRIRKINKSEKVEIILAMNPTMEGEATALYIKKKIEGLDSETEIKITRIGSGLPIGADLEFADQITLSRAMEGRREI